MVVSIGSNVFHLGLVCVLVSMEIRQLLVLVHPPTNLPCITVGASYSANLISALQREQLLPHRKRLSPIAQLIVYHLCLWTLSASTLSPFLLHATREPVLCEDNAM